MKPTLLITLGLCLSVSLFATQTWPPETAKWIYSHTFEPLDSYKIYVSGGQININDKNGRIITNNQDDEEILLLEENGQVFYCFNDEFHLIYDFTLTEGAEVTFNLMGASPESIEYDMVYDVTGTVETISNINVDGISLKQFTIHLNPVENADHLVWDNPYIYIENIGYEYDFLFKLNLPSIGQTLRLRCYEDEDITYIADWWQQEGVSCDFTTSLPYSQITNAGESLISPNPAIDVINIYQDGKVTVQIVDLNGHVLLQKSFSGKIEINVNHLPRGIYFVNFFGQESNATKKLILTER